MDERLRDLLYRSFDGELSTAQQARLEAALRSDEALRVERTAIAALRAAAAGSAAQGFGPFFADRVMAHIAADQRETAAGLSTALTALFRPVAVSVAIVTAALSPLAVPVLVESMSARQPTLVSMAQQTYTVELEDVLCQQE